MLCLICAMLGLSNTMSGLWYILVLSCYDLSYALPQVFLSWVLTMLCLSWVMFELSFVWLRMFGLSYAIPLRYVMSELSYTM